MRMSVMPQKGLSWAPEEARCRHVKKVSMAQLDGRKGSGGCRIQQYS